MRARAALLILSTLGTLCLAHAAALQNSLTIRILDGPFAGTYTPPRSEVICLHAQAQRVFSAAWKSFQAQQKGNAFTEGGLQVSNPDSPGKKLGDISLIFADPAGHSTTYSISNAPIDYAPDAAGATISFEGSASSGIRIKIRAECVDVTHV